MKIEIFKALLYIAIGAWLGIRFKQESKPQQLPIIEQKQQSECKVVVKKITKPDGSIDEITEFLAKSNQVQKVKPVELKKEVFGGLGTDLKLSLSLKTDNQLHQIMSNGKEHVYYFHYKLLEF